MVLESFLDWINIQININSVVDLSDSESQRRERDRYPQDINCERKEQDQNYGNGNRKGRAENINNQPVRMKSSKIQEKPCLKIERRILNAEYAIQVNTNKSIVDNSSKQM
jgi:hypothetical protein